ncbi:UDP-2,3-diacylglucosamine diphosphatase [Nitratifractor sp.]
MRSEELEEIGSSIRHSASSIQHPILEDALFVADAHYPHHGEEFLALLRALEAGEVETPQLFLMGDVFDLLFGCGSYIRSFASEAIAAVQRLSRRIEVHYFEGNHDFCLASLFPDAHVYPRSLQPIMMEMGGRRVALAHGDRYDTGIGYEIYTLLLRRCRAMCLLLPWEKGLIDRPMRRLRSKKICREIPGFSEKVERILRHYPPEAERVIEGHFHQRGRFGRYVALPSLACQKEVGVVRNGEIIFVPVAELLDGGFLNEKREVRSEE